MLHSVHFILHGKLENLINLGQKEAILSFSHAETLLMDVLKILYKPLSCAQPKQKRGR